MLVAIAYSLERKISNAQATGLAKHKTTLPNPAPVWGFRTIIVENS
jgi:hypothetical protein